jgi:hypothetical protein
MFFAASGRVAPAVRDRPLALELALQIVAELSGNYLSDA